MWETPTSRSCARKRSKPTGTNARTSGGQSANRRPAANSMARARRASPPPETLLVPRLCLTVRLG
eukprot:5612249-Lingulodinium_polyedra.AAC.1